MWSGKQQHGSTTVCSGPGTGFSCRGNSRGRRLKPDNCRVTAQVPPGLPPASSESESEMFLFDPYQKYIQSNNETILDQGTPIKTSLVANIRAAYYIINNYFFISQAKNT